MNAQRPRTRIQRRNRRLILDAALEVFSVYGFRGATLDQIAAEAGLSKPNLLYYFAGKEDIHRTLLTQLLDAWLAPLGALDPAGEPVEEILAYVRRKIQMSREFPRESRLFANEILQGAPRIEAFIRGDLKALFDEKAQLIESWVRAGRLAETDPRHLLFSIWALTQNYADFEAQMRMLRASDDDPFEGVEVFLCTFYRRALAPAAGRRNGLPGA